MILALVLVGVGMLAALTAVVLAFCSDVAGEDISALGFVSIACWTGGLCLLVAVQW